MTWCWFAVLDESDEAALSTAERANATASAIGRDGSSTCLLAAWPAGRKPVRHAVRMDARVVDTEGEAVWVSLVLIPAGREPLFDDPAVSGALRQVLTGPPSAAVTTFVRDSSHFAGALTVQRNDPALLRDDPFARLHPARVLRVESGLLGHVLPPSGPVTQRYAGQPWPAGGF
ncbi:MAG TPA: hypothetical protein VES02_10875 [Dermatophilaceae bacterium]|nr:hypothetical protein [Dermatophilaceae bacterium]